MSNKHGFIPSINYVLFQQNSAAEHEIWAPSSLGWIYLFIHQNQILHLVEAISFLYQEAVEIRAEKKHNQSHTTFLLFHFLFAEFKRKPKLRIYYDESYV